MLYESDKLWEVYYKYIENSYKIQRSLVQGRAMVTQIFHFYCSLSSILWWMRSVGIQKGLGNAAFINGLVGLILMDGQKHLQKITLSSSNVNETKSENEIILMNVSGIFHISISHINKNWESLHRNKRFDIVFQKPKFSNNARRKSHWSHASPYLNWVGIILHL